MEQGCWAMPWALVLLAGWSVSLPVALRSHGQFTMEKDEIECLHSTVHALRQVLRANSHTGCKRGTKTGICPLLDDPDIHVPLDEAASNTQLDRAPYTQPSCSPPLQHSLAPAKTVESLRQFVSRMCSALLKSQPHGLIFLPHSQRETGNKRHPEAYRVVAPSSLHRSWMEARLFYVGTNRWSQLPLGLCWSIVPLRNCGTSHWNWMRCRAVACVVPG